ncbi:MAG: hypothetical protein E7527_03095 [Ruminococcaceae bacterium]|nr:hypothetical protein [Oscillospiraceae bacterium]
MTIQKLKTYLENLPAGWVVTGHSAPDADAVISALFEAYRLTVAGTPAAPVLQGALPREVAYLLGDLAILLPTTDALDPAVPLVLTDHNDVAAYQNPVMAVVDHHPVTTEKVPSGIDTEIRPVGAATTLVAFRLRRDGITPDAGCARLLLGAILLDTENLSPRKAKAEDREAVAWLAPLCGADTDALFAALQAELLSETDVATLYRRDYRRYTDPKGQVRLGWAILKVWADACPDPDVVRHLLAQDTAPTRVAKIVQNSRTDGTRTEYYLAAGEEAEALLTLVQSMAGDTAVRTAPDTVFLPETAAHWGRKRYAVLLNETWRKKS